MLIWSEKIINKDQKIKIDWIWNFGIKKNFFFLEEKNWKVKVEKIYENKYKYIN